MHSPASAIVWEIWRKNRYGFLAIMALLVLFAVINRTLARFEVSWSDNIDGGNVMCLILAYVGLLVFFSHTEIDGRGWFGFPSRLFTLPVRTGAIVHPLVLSGMAAAALLTFVWLRLWLPPTAGKIPISHFVLLSAAGMVSFQAIVWSLAGWPKIQTLTLVALLIGFTWSACLPFIHEDGNWWRRWRDAAAISLWGTIAVAHGAALLSVHRQRSGGGREWFGWPGMERILPALSPRPHRVFSTAAQAQLWIEWQRNGVVPLVALAILFVGAYWLLARAATDDFLASLTVTVLPIANAFALPLWAALSGLSVARDITSGQLPLSSFISTHPVSPGEIVAAKLKVAAVLAGFAAVALGVYVFWVSAYPSVGESSGWLAPPWLRTSGFRLFLLCNLALIWNLMIGFLPLWLTGRTPGFPWSLSWLLAFGIGLVMTAMWFAERPHYWGMLTGFLLAAWVGKVGIALCSFRAALQRGLMAARMVWIYASIWLIATVWLVVAAYRLTLNTPVPASLAMSAAALLFPFARVGLAPLALAWNRHR